MMDLSLPVYSMNINNLKSVETKKDLKLEITQNKPLKTIKGKSNFNVKDLGITSA